MDIHPKSTEETYVGQVKEFIRHLDDSRLEKDGEPEIADLLTDLAVTHEVSANTQNQSLSAILFFSEKVLGRNSHCFLPVEKSVGNTGHDVLR